MPIESLPRAHSERFGWLDKSNWRDLDNRRNLRKVDPALREIIQLLNKKGYKTYSSCSGGHSTDLSRRHQQHMEGYIAFSPPSRVSVDLYFTLLGKTDHFQLSTNIGILDEDNEVDHTVFSELRWQLQDGRKHRNEYYRELFDRLRRAVERLPYGDPSQDRKFAGTFFGRGNARRGFRIVDEQHKRFH